MFIKDKFNINEVYMQKELIIKGAKQYSDHVTTNIPQKTEDNIIKYYFSGSLAMLLLSSAKSLKTMNVDENGIIKEQGQEISIPSANKNSLFKGVRAIGNDVDVILIDDTTFQGKGAIYSLSVIREKCDLATTLCPAWTYSGTGYCDFLSDDRKFTAHNVAELTMNDDSKVFIVDPLDLIFHKFADAIFRLQNINRELVRNETPSFEQEEDYYVKQYRKDLNDFASLFNGIVSLYQDINFDKTIEHIINTNWGTAFYRLMRSNFNDELEQFSNHLENLKLIDEGNQELFENFINCIDEQNKAILEAVENGRPI